MSRDSIWKRARLRGNMVFQRRLAKAWRAERVYLRVVERCGRMESTTVGERTVRVSRDSI